MAEQEQQKVRISISEVQRMLREGKDRKEIGQHYGLKPFEIKNLFAHPKLKGLKVASKPNFELIDDAPEDAKPAKAVSQPTNTATQAQASARAATSSADTESKTPQATGQSIKESPSEQDNVKEETGGVW